jgi:hypothetical protein
MMEGDIRISKNKETDEIYFKSDYRKNRSAPFYYVCPDIDIYIYI